MNDEEKFVIETAPEPIEEKPATRFPVVAQLSILLLILGGIFAGVIIPKTMTALNHEEVPPIKNVATLTPPTQENKVLQKIDVVDIQAQAAFVWDVKEQRVLYQKNADEKLALASITKLMTALLAYELLDDDEYVTVGTVAASQESGGNLNEGEVFNIRDLADFALVSSYNSAAYAIANSVGAKLGDGDAVAQFVTAMNLRAKELGFTDLSYLNPTGLDLSAGEAGAYGTARDVSFLMEYILTNYPAILAPTISDHAKIYNLAGEYHEAKNTNNIVDEIPNLIGSKTGYTDLAGGNLTVALDIGFAHPVVITVLGSTISERFSDVQKLIEAVQGTVVKSE
ncbi:MAG: D-alanyl-D-alanine carboxypeptidase [Candidatus Nomurabacteria bacterium]|nr:MAG: D-alanyl-D-alanine carboxypeptidase [Candidatus Nomurabacteria bacterium]